MNGMSRFLSRREKKYGKNGSENSNHLIPIFELFSPLDHWKKLTKDEEVKVKEICVQLQSLGIDEFKEPQAEYALRSGSSSRDVKKALQLLLILKDTLEGRIISCKQDLALLGAENRESVTCFLDSLLFAMFARLNNFEGLLYDIAEEGPRKRLAALLRLWVNMLRSELLITVDITKHIQEALCACGWSDAANLTQQDSSEAFTFITGKLGLPLLTLKMDIYHTGKEDMNDDHKTINERLLEVAIPENSDDNSSVTLESCLEAYFNNRIEVKRHMHRMSTVQKLKSEPKDETVHIEAIEVSSQPSSPVTEIADNHLKSARPMSIQSRNNSIFSERYADDDGNPDASAEEAVAAKGRPRKGSLRKEVLMPAWQFFRLIPWYSENAPTSDDQVASHFASQRPILGICLKRYSMYADGKTKRRNTHVDIPLEIGLPHFVNEESICEDGPLFIHFKLSLQSIVCHRGKSVDSGHYVALVRDNLAKAQESQSNSPTEESDNFGTWLLFDDLAKDRVQKVDIAEALREESPYLLFYQVQPIDDTSTSERKPPPYSEPTTNAEASKTSESTSTANEESTALAKTEESSDFETANNGTTPHTNCEPSSVPQAATGGRPSANCDVINDQSYQETAVATPAPITTPLDDTKSGYFSSSRRTSKIGMRGSWSRASSQSGEGSRLSFSLGKRNIQAGSDRNNVPAESSTQDRNKSSTRNLAANEGKIEPSMSSKASGRARSKSRKDSRRQRMSMQIERAMNEKLPDRQCLLM